MPFHYALDRLDEQTARALDFDVGAHLFAAHAASLNEIDEPNAKKLPREALVAAVAQVPDDFLETAFPGIAPPTMREIYVAVLWKRLKAPRPFVPSFGVGDTT
jgi:hypothetical protein